jgi:transposase-like protein
MDAYSEDLRKKIVKALTEQRMNKSEAARAFSVSLSSVKRYAKAASEGRSLSPGKAPGQRAHQRVPRNWGKNITLLSSISKERGMELLWWWRVRPTGPFFELTWRMFCCPR